MTRIASAPPDAIKIPIDQGGMDILPTGVHEPVFVKTDAVFVGLDGMLAVYTFILFSKAEFRKEYRKECAIKHICTGMFYYALF